MIYCLIVVVLRWNWICFIVDSESRYSIEWRKNRVWRWKSGLFLFYQGLPGCFWIRPGRVKMFWPAVLWLNIKCWTSPGLKYIRWPGLFTTRAFIKDRTDFIIYIVSFAIFHLHFIHIFLPTFYNPHFYHTHFIIRILSSAFYHDHPHFISRSSEQATAYYRSRSTVSELLF